MYKSKYHNPYKQDQDPDISLFKQPEINDTIKENEDVQTVEIEKGEVVAKPELGALYKAKGNTHAKGGIKTYLEPGSFVFSNDKSMSLSKGEHELMELKQGGSVKKKLNTPAEVLKRNVDIKHYNRLVNNLEDPITNDLTKRSSALMLAKYQDAIGKIAYLQEGKKQFQQGVPEFSQGTAPVYDADLKKNIKEQPQYMATGGITNPYDAECPCGKDANGECIKCTQAQLASIAAKSATGNAKYAKGLKHIGNDGDYDIYHTGTDPRKAKKVIQTPGPKMSNADWEKFVKSPAGRARRAAMEQTTPGTDRFLKVPVSRNKITITGGEQEILPPEQAPDPKPTDPNTGLPSEPYNPYVGMSFDQTMNLGYAGLNAASVKRYDPYRQQVKSPLVEQEYFNSQGAINQASGAGNSALNASRVLNPYLANAANQETTGKLLDNLNNIDTLYSDRNVQVGNQQNALNSRIQREDLSANLGFDSKYYDQTVAARQNFDDLKSVANNEVMGLYNTYRGQNRQLQEFLSQQPIAGSVPVRDKKGKIIGYKEQPLYGYDSWSGRTVRTGAGNIMNARPMPQASNQLALMQEVGKKILESGDPKALALYYNSLDNFTTSKNSIYGNQYKKGGVYNPYN